jgi:hypothetical protein
MFENVIHIIISLLKGILKKLLIILMMIPFSGHILAQQNGDKTAEAYRNQNQSQSQSQSSSNNRDSIKLKIHVQLLRPDMLSFDSVPFDTILENIHVQNPAYKNRVTSSFLGNIGLAAKSNNYYEYDHSADMFLANTIKYNFIHKEDIQYYTTNHPFSNITYNASASKSVDMQSIKFLHTQNVNKNLNLGMLLNLHGSNGMYLYQASSSNALSLFSSYQSDYYSLNCVVSYNTLKNNENGGLTSDTLFENNKDKGAVYPTSLQKAVVNYRNSYIFIAQRFNLAGIRKLTNPKSDSVRRFSGIGLLHTMEFDRNKRRYVDVPTFSSSTSSINFYPAVNIDSIATKDSLFYFHLQNAVEILLGKQNPNEPPILLRAGIKHIYDNFSYNIRPDTIISENSSGKNDTTIHKMYKNSYSNLAFTGGISIGIKSFFLLNANADYYVTGYKAGDLYLHGKLSNRFSRKSGSPSFIILADISRYKPGYLYKSFFSNHYQWNNGFIPIKEVHTGIEFSWPAIKFNADFNYSLLSSPLYFDSLSFPQQLNGEMSIIEASGTKAFQAGIFHTAFKALVQITSNDKVIPLPLFSASNSSYIELKLFKKVMTTQLGYSVRYNTAYYANGYMPALGTFYNQRTRKLGNYPYIDAFLDVKLKRMCFYFKLEHANADMFSRSYYTVLHYPMNSRMLIFGLSWNFYD